MSRLRNLRKKDYILLFVTVIWLLTFFINMFFDDQVFVKSGDNLRLVKMNRALPEFQKASLKRMFETYKQYYALHILLKFSNIGFLIFIAYLLYKDIAIRRRNRIIAERDFSRRLSSLKLVDSVVAFLSDKELEHRIDEFNRRLIRVLSGKDISSEDIKKIAELLIETAHMTCHDRIEIFQKNMNL
jgi:hypothetical protein